MNSQAPAGLSKRRAEAAGKIDEDNATNPPAAHGQVSSTITKQSAALRAAAKAFAGQSASVKPSPQTGRTGHHGTQAAVTTNLEKTTTTTRKSSQAAPKQYLAEPSTTLRPSQVAATTASTRSSPNRNTFTRGSGTPGRTSTRSDGPDVASSPSLAAAKTATARSSPSRASSSTRSISTNRAVTRPTDPAAAYDLHESISTPEASQMHLEHLQHAIHRAETFPEQISKHVFQPIGHTYHIGVHSVRSPPAQDLLRTSSSESQSPLGTVEPDFRGRLQRTKIGLTESELADAIVAWSVASSRAASPAKRPQAAPRRRSQSHSLVPRHRTWSTERTKHHEKRHILRHTLRSQKSEPEDEETTLTKRGRHHLIRKHQHKHHEGDRKRWRDRVTEGERKRYEGVWAANKGLYTYWPLTNETFGTTTGIPHDSGRILNLVVREVWERSCLPKVILEEVWDLVAREEASSLHRDEFVVGLWLIDQSLKGRKLPASVSPHVWNSVRHTHGVKFSSHKTV